MCFEHEEKIIVRNPEELKYYKYISVNNLFYFDKKNCHIYERWGHFMNNYPGIKIGKEIFIDINSDKLYSDQFEYSRDPSIRFTFYCLSIITDKPSQHANAFVVDHYNKIAYRYEPHGAQTNTYNYLQIDKLLKNNLDPDYSYINPWGYQEIYGPQSFEFSSKDNFYGFCLAWSLKFMHMRVLYPDLSIKELDKLMLSDDIGSLANQIRAYTSFLNSYSEYSGNQIITRSFIDANRY